MPTDMDVLLITVLIDNMGVPTAYLLEESKLNDDPAVGLNVRPLLWPVNVTTFSVPLVSLLSSRVLTGITTVLVAITTLLGAATWVPWLSTGKVEWCREDVVFSDGVDCLSSRLDACLVVSIVCCEGKCANVLPRTSEVDGCLSVGVGVSE